MKNIKSFSAILSLSLLTAACSEYSKSPVADLDTLRDSGKVEMQNPNESRVERVEVPVETPSQKTIIDKLRLMEIQLELNHKSI